MGMFKKNSWSYFDGCISPNPNPKVWKIIKYKQLKDFLVVKIKYPNCTNYEGNKVLVFKGISLNTLISQKEIDPHFSENKNKYSPIARFEPTEEGWIMAIRFFS